MRINGATDLADKEACMMLETRTTATPAEPECNLSFMLSGVGLLEGVGFATLTGSMVEAASFV